MKYNNCVSLKGKQVIFNNNLLGKEISCGGYKEPDEIYLLKQSIINQFILPLCKSNWHEIKENMFNISRFQNRIKNYKKKYNNPDLNFYDQILDFIIITFSEHLNLQNLEQKVYGNDKTHAANLIQKIKYIRLKAEYELYNTILGKPDFKNKENYNPEIISSIKSLLKNENITFKEINNKIIKFKI